MSELETDLRKSLDELARACRILEMEGHGDMTLGHLSLRDPEGRGFWLKRNRIGLGEVQGAGDFVLVDWDGGQLAGSGGRHSEWPIHSEILRMRPDVHVVAHTHPFHACVFSAALDPLEPFGLDADYFIHVPRHADQVALITTKEEGVALAQSLGGAVRGPAGQSWRDVLRHVHPARDLRRGLSRKGVQGPTGGTGGGLAHLHAGRSHAREAQEPDDDPGALGSLLALFLPQARGTQRGGR